MVEDIRETRAPGSASFKADIQSPANPSSLLDAVSKVVSARRYNDTSAYHGYPSSLRPPVVAMELSQVLFRLHDRGHGEEELLTLLSTQHALRALHDDAMKVCVLM